MHLRDNIKSNASLMETWMLKQSYMRSVSVIVIILCNSVFTVYVLYARPTLGTGPYFIVREP